MTGLSIHVTKSVLPAPKQFRDIIECAGGTYLASEPKRPLEGQLVVSCDEDKKVMDKLKEKNISLVDKEFILTGILRHKLDSFPH